MTTDGRLAKLLENRMNTPASVYHGAHRHQPRKHGKFVKAFRNTVELLKSQIVVEKTEDVK